VNIKSNLSGAGAVERENSFNAYNEPPVVENSAIERGQSLR